MTPIEAKRKYPRNLLMLLLTDSFWRVPKAFCTRCNRHIDELMGWQCGYCPTVVKRKDASKLDPIKLRDATTYHDTIFGRCPGCEKHPPAIICPQCNELNPLLNASEEEQKEHAARSTDAFATRGQEVVEEERMKNLVRYTALVEAETKKLEAEFRRKVAERNLNPPLPEPADQAVRRRLLEPLSNMETLNEVRAERLAAFEKQYAGDPVALEKMRNMLDDSFERVRVALVQGK